MLTPQISVPKTENRQNWQNDEIQNTGGSGEEHHEDEDDVNCYSEEYKNYDKMNFLESIIEKSVFYDDNDKILNDASSLKHIDVFDAKKIQDWSSLIIHQ